MRGGALLYLGIHVVNSMRGFAQPLLESGRRGVVWEVGGSAGGGVRLRTLLLEAVLRGETTASSSKNKKSERKWRATKKDTGSVLGYSVRRQA